MVSENMKLNNYSFLLYPFLVAVFLAWAVTGFLAMKTTSSTPISYDTSVKKQQSKAKLPDTELILTKNIFDAEVDTQAVAMPEISGGSAPGSSGAVQDSGFEGTLVGILSSDDQSIAVVEYKGKKYVLNMLEEKDGLMLVEVGYYHAVITRGGERYKLILKKDSDKSAGKTGTVKMNDSSSSTTEKTKISRREVIEQLSDVNNVIKSVLIVPFERNGNFEGYRVRRMTNTSILKKLGVNRNDVIMRLNGKSLESPSVFFDALKNAENLSAVSLDILRSGKKMTLYVEIEG